MNRPFTTSKDLFQHLVALRDLERELPLVYAHMVNRARQMRRRCAR